MLTHCWKIDMYDFPLLLQSTPSLVISLLGLLTTGRILENSIEDKTLDKYPLLLQSNCILNFKGNIELIYALYISSLRQSPFFHFPKYVRYAFDNANVVILQSIVIGISVGFIGVSKSVLTGGIQLQVLSTIIAASVVTCLITTIMFIVSLFVTIEIAKQLKIDPDNVILPAISSLSDYFGIYFLIFFTKYFRNTPVDLSMLIVIFLMFVVPICMIFSFMSKVRMPIQSIEILIFTYVISTTGGYILDSLSTKFKFIASSFPAYSGLAVSISFIHLHKIFTATSNNTYHDTGKSYRTLTLSSFIMIIFYLALSTFLEGKKPLYYYLLFVSLFVIQVMLLLKLVERIVEYFGQYDGDIGVVSLPIITAFGDIISTTSLLLIAFIIKINRLYQ
ncbi:Solute carrier family 41 member 2 [Nosema granulosis]|uniref:Solute carrier family 41 member 2 n=1 Tax=Nosema granulosis TaxID=83296 RepID=A0A9P6KY15_9MICR|nr:Solute carrier family 41 member 2 [Nosema granulosis]